ncbi:MAG: transposase [Phyllobacterium sp.]
MQTEQAKSHCRKRMQTVKPAFGIINSAIGFRGFSLRGLAKVAAESTLVTLANNCRRMTTLMAHP